MHAWRSPTIWYVCLQKWGMGSPISGYVCGKNWGIKPRHHGRSLSLAWCKGLFTGKWLTMVNQILDNMDVFDKSCNHMKLTYQHTSPMGISTDRIQFGSDQWSLTVSTACCLTANSSNVFKRVMCWDAACDHVNESAILEFDPRVAPHVPELGNLRMSLRACWTGMKVDDTVDVENWRYNRIQCTILKGKKTKCFTAAASNCSFYMSNTQPPSFVSSHLRLSVLHDLLRQSVPFGIQASLRIHKVFGHHRGLAVWVSPSPSTHVFFSRSLNIYWVAVWHVATQPYRPYPVLSNPLRSLPTVSSTFDISLSCMDIEWHRYHKCVSIYL